MVALRSPDVHAASPEEFRRVVAARLIVCVSRIHTGWPTLSVERDIARDVVSASGSPACVMHLPIHETWEDDEAPSISFADQLSWYERRPVVFFNTSNAASAADCANTVNTIAQWVAGVDQFADRALYKLEIFDQNLHCRSDQLIEAVAHIDPHLRQRCVPIIEPEPDAARALIDLGVGGVRLRAGEIRRGTGILLRDDCAATIRAVDGAVAVVLEGGLATERDVYLAAEIGADAVLFNSAIADSADPVGLTQRLRRAADEAWT